MTPLLTLTDKDIFESPTQFKGEWYTRRAARAVVLNEHGEVYLLKMAVRNYHKLPGGGIDEGEEVKDALQRELFEEIGCPVIIGGEIGEVIEYRGEMGMEQHSYCYFAKQSGPLRETALEEDEVEDGAETVVATNIDEAIALLETDEPNNYDGKFIQKRDLCLLREAKKLSVSLG